MNVTIKDIARKANVSYATVSRALNNKEGVNEETRQRIIRIAQEMGYKPNAIARGLVKRHTNTIGLVIPDITNPFFPEVARGVEDAANEQGYSILLCNTNWEQEREETYINLLMEKRVDGIIIAPISKDTNYIEDLLGDHFPLVYVSRVPEGTQNSFVVIDNTRGGFLATKHLIEQGYKKIGYIGGTKGSASSQDRFKGYQLAFEKYGIEYEPRFIVSGDFKRETGYNIMKKLLEGPEYPDAVFAENDLLALGAMQAIREKGLKIPQDIAVVGFDDIPFASFPEVQLTTICQPKYEMGRIAAQILMDKLTQKKGKNTDRKVILEPELIVRKSSV